MSFGNEQARRWFSFFLFIFSYREYWHFIGKQDSSKVQMCLWHHTQQRAPQPDLTPPRPAFVQPFRWRQAGLSLQVCSWLGMKGRLSFPVLRGPRVSALLSHRDVVLSVHSILCWLLLSARSCQCCTLRYLVLLRHSTKLAKCSRFGAAGRF